jgi:hypothetical protein
MAVTTSRNTVPLVNSVTATHRRSSCTVLRSAIFKTTQTHTHTHDVLCRKKIIINYYFPGSAAQPGLWPSRTRGSVIRHNDTPHSVGLIWTSDQPVAETSTRQHTQQTNIHASGGIRIHDRSRRASVELGPKPRGHWDQLSKGNTAL